MAAMVCWFALYWVMTTFDRPTPWYNGEAAYRIVLVAALLTVPVLFGRFVAHRRDFRDYFPVLICAGVLVAATIFAHDQLAAAARLRMIFSVFFLGLALGLWFDQSSRHVVHFVFLAIGVFHVGALILVVQGIPNANPNDPFDHSWVPYHAHVRHLSYHGMVSACCGFGLLVLGGRLRLAGAVISAVSLAGILYFGARGALLGWLVFVLVTLVLCARIRFNILAAGLILIIAGVAATYLNSEFHSTPFTGTVWQRTQSLSQTVSTTGRTDIWLDAIRATMNRPVLGFGLDGYWTSSCCLPGTVQPHNAIVQIFTETGLLGLLAFGWLLLRVFAKPVAFLRKHAAMREQNVDIKLLFALLTGFLAFSMIDGLFYHVVPLLLFSTILALFLSRFRSVCSTGQ